MLVNYSYHIWYKVCKVVRIKYKLSTNALLVLHGAYLYYTILNKSFTRFNLQNFVTYYNHVKIKYFVELLISKGYLIESGNYKGHLLYCISELGLQVINDLNKSYQEQLYIFCNKYSIEL